MNGARADLHQIWSSPLHMEAWFWYRLRTLSEGGLDAGNIPSISGV